MRVLRFAWLALGLTRPAFAQVPAELPSASDPSTYSLSWVRDDGAESCPTGRELAKDVTARLGRSPFNENADRSIEIRVERTATGFRSRVHVLASDGHVLGRRLLASDEPACATLFSATALAVALLIDPDATRRGNPSPPSVATFDVPEAPSLPPATLPLPAPPPAPPAADTSAAPKLEREPVASTSALAVLALGFGPGDAIGAALHVAGKPSRRWGFAATALYVSPSETTEQGVSLSAGATTFGGFVTYSPFPDVANVTVEAGPWLGVLQARVLPPAPGPETTFQVASGDYVFAALSAGAGLEAHVTSSIFITTRALLLLPLVRHRLTLSVEGVDGPVITELWTQPALAAALSAGLGLSFF